MAYVDLVSSDGYGRYNRKFAKLAGLTAAVYWSEILDISTKVVKKKKFDDEGYFKVDRKYIEDRTTLTVEEQLESDSILTNIGVLEIKDLDPSMIRVQLRVFAELLIDDKVQPNESLKKKTKTSRSQAAANKKAGIIITMKRCIPETDPELRAEYESWVDSVYAASRFLTKDIINKFYTAVNNYTTDKKVKLKLLEEAITSGYTDFSWIQNRYESSTRTSKVSNGSAARLPEQKIATKVNTDQTF